MSLPITSVDTISRDTEQSPLHRTVQELHLRIVRWQDWVLLHWFRSEDVFCLCR